MPDVREETRPPENEFSREAGEARTGLAAEFWDFLKHNKKWWLLPIVLAIVGECLAVTMKQKREAALETARDLFVIALPRSPL